SWEALSANFRAHGGQGDASSLRNRVFIDFDANADELRRLAAASETVPFDVIHARWTYGMHWGSGPNAELHRYLRRRAGVFDHPRPAEGWRSDRDKRLANDLYQCGFAVQFDEMGNIISAWGDHFAPREPADEDFLRLRVYPKIRHINLVWSKVTDAGLAILPEFRELERLEISNPITDAGLAHLREHPRLSDMDVFGTLITEAGFAHLETIPQLRSLRFDTERISPEAVRRLQLAKPRLVIQPVGELRGD
ncbi:MAG TPA: hypothetical protein VM165_07345, partial [Planctomycetaceae bacterium]|nr:hypothetical protein [Planctomycetaceae bacterium]